MPYLLLAKEVPNLNGLVIVCDGGVNGKVSVDKAHLVAEARGNTGDEVLDVAEGGADRGGGLPRREPGIGLELEFPGFLVFNQLEIQIQMLEVPGELASRTLNLDLFRLHLDFHPVGDVHRLGREYRLHRLSLTLSRRPECWPAENLCFCGRLYEV
ncbi:hypothetical protein DM860_015323 [Cuscuta australis]|uniref:Uncharacterized protein n=1 Tax=Cuscuta australis TaxID=267555 RepID=A0A328DM41_9ASTE|nr:hypothetical protein DM860_015323 [Cuscuta australis]